MELTVLVENRSGKKTAAAHGLAYLINDGKETFLFDTGPSDLLIKNAKILNINLSEINTVVLSHGHWDHGNGLPYLFGKTLITHPQAFIKRYRNSNNSYVGLSIDIQDANKEFRLILSETPYKITETTYYLGTIPYETKFEKPSDAYHLENGENDSIPDDSAIVTTTPKGLIIITGCSHSGICNIIKYAQEVTGISSVYAVIGGFHLMVLNNKLTETITCLKAMNITHLYPSHCTSFEAQCELAKHLPIKGLKTGDIFKF